MLSNEISRPTRFARAALVVVVLAAAVLSVSMVATFWSGTAFAKDPIAQGATTESCANGDCSQLINKYIDPFIRLLSGLVGIVVTMSIIWGGIQYSMAKDENARVTAAKQRIEKSIAALLAYLVLLAFLNWLIPGGIV